MFDECENCGNPLKFCECENTECEHQDCQPYDWSDGLIYLTCMDCLEVVNDTVLGQFQLFDDWQERLAESYKQK